MYELKRVYTNISERYVEGKGWINGTIETGDKVTLYALDYIEIDDAGNVHGTGVEDFSVERFKKLGFAAVELKNKVKKENPTLKTTYKHELVKRFYIRFNNRKAVNSYKNYIHNRYIHELIFNEISASYH